MNLQVMNSINLFKSFHIVISCTFIIIAVWLIIRSARSIIRKYPYTTLDKYLSYCFIILLYLQLIFGLIIFTGPIPPEKFIPDTEGTLRLVSKRFWPVEHIVLMLFALFIANIGLVFSSQTSDNLEKHRKVLIYYSIAVVMIIISIIAVNLP